MARVEELERELELEALSGDRRDTLEEIAGDYGYTVDELGRSRSWRPSALQALK